MLTDETLSLLTAAVDGELTPAESRRFARLLDASEEARDLYARLKADSDRLRVAVRAVPPPGLLQRIMARIATVSQPVPVYPSRPASGTGYRRPSRPWIPAAVAAGLLLGVATGSFWFFSRQEPVGRTADRNPNRPPPATRNGADDPGWLNWLPADSARPPSAPVVLDPDRTVAPVVRAGEDPRPHAAGPDAVAVAPDPRPHRPDFITAPPGPDAPSFDLVRVRVPFLRPLTDFDREDTRQHLAEDVALDPAVRIDLFTRDPVRGVQLLQAAARAAKVTVFADATTLDRVQKRFVGTVVLYIESLTPAELADLFARLNIEDAKVSPRVFDQLHATPAAAGEERGLREVLGVDVGLFERPAGDRSDPREKLPEPGKSIGAGTADHIVKSLATGAVKPAEKTAVLLTWAPTAARTVPAASQELKSFLAKRGDRNPNAVPTLIVIRPGNG
jgi:hypothetical protein